MGLHTVESMCLPYVLVSPFVALRVTAAVVMHVSKDLYPC